MEPQKEPNPNYLPYPPQSQSTDDEIDLRELFGALWKGKWIIIATTFVFAVGAVLYALSLPNIYKSDALLAPAESSGGGGLSKMAGQLSGLAAFAGVSLGSSESSQSDLAVQVLQSRQFVENFVKKHDLLIPLMAVKGWNMESDRLIIDEDIYDVSTDSWIREPEGMRKAKPSTQEAFEVFVKNILNVAQDKETGLYTLSVNYYSPHIAQTWVTWLIEDINQVMRERTIEESTQNLAYLNAQLEKTAVADMKSTFYKLIEEQTKSLMIAEVQEEFVFKVIDPAISPEIKSGPKRITIIIIGLLLGAVVSCCFVMIKSIFLKLK
ncbi:Wzz/FepE/Etk N-terminal domain-containing protein [Vibrio harveyi]